MRNEKAEAKGAVVTGNKVSLPVAHPYFTVFIDGEMREGVVKLCDFYFLSFFISLFYFSVFFFPFPPSTEKSFAPNPIRMEKVQFTV
jgi:hypothetical protein